MDITAWPFVNDIDELFYFKPEAGPLFLSPADETPSPPGDVQPEEWDIAAAVDRVQAATTLQIDRLKARWAGLRTFAPDRSPVVGFSTEAQGFFWLAGQGGYGIQTAPAFRVRRRHWSVDCRFPRINLSGSIGPRDVSVAVSARHRNR